MVLSNLFCVRYPFSSDPGMIWHLNILRSEWQHIYLDYSNIHICDVTFDTVKEDQP